MLSEVEAFKLGWVLKGKNPTTFSLNLAQGRLRPTRPNGTGGSDESTFLSPQEVTVDSLRLIHPTLFVSSFKF